MTRAVPSYPPSPRRFGGQAINTNPMFYAYILQSITDPTQFYRGHTSDLKQRFAEHNSGKCPHTAKYIPWKLRFYAAFESLELAQQFEKYLNSGSGHAFSKRHLGL